MPFAAFAALRHLRVTALSSAAKRVGMVKGVFADARNARQL
jgi:hypothetical protein